MLETFFIGLFIASVCSTGAMFLKLIEAKKEVAEQKKIAADSQAQVLRLQEEKMNLEKQIDAAQLENSKLKAQPPKSAAISVRMRRPDRGLF